MSFDPHLIALVRKQASALVAADICAVQPMDSSEIGSLFRITCGPKNEAETGRSHDVPTQRQWELRYQEGREAAKRGWERRLPNSLYSGATAWFAGFDSYGAMTR